MTDYSNLITDSMRALRHERGRDVLILDIEDDGVSIWIKTEYGNDGVPMSVWHGRTRRFTLATGQKIIDLDAARIDLAEGGKVAVLIDRIQAGLDSDWNGSNMVGTLTADADDAEDELRDMIEREQLNWGDDAWALWDIGEWLASARHEITSEMTDDDIAAWAEEAERNAASDNVILNGDADDIASWAREVRAEKIADQAE